jgi:D-alanyl-D-alanine carboxypeptidase/D-alanyl-D-alanine-endopeptidase (penicillin-binding protein 4)
MIRIALIGVPVCCAALVPAPAVAVDRSAGAAVPKPVASGAPWSEAEIASLSANVDLALAGAKTLRGAHVGLLAVDAREGRVLYQRAADDAFQPASTLKLLTGSAALDKLGPDYRLTTEVVAGGPVEDGVLRGELLLRGGGDPFLSAADLAAAADAVAKAGIVRVSSGVAVDDARHERAASLPGWSVDDVPYPYAAPISALSLEQNVVHVTVSPGASAGAPAIVRAGPGTEVGRSIEGCAPTVRVRIVPAAVTGPPGAKDTVDFTRERSGCIVVTGTIPAGAQPDMLDAAVVSPAVYAHDVFAAALRARGVVVVQPEPLAAPWPWEYRSGTPPSPAARTLWRHDSEPLRDLLGELWIPSDNLLAELLLRELGLAQSGAPGTTANGIAVETGWLRALGADTTASLALEDGSGLSAYDRITPRALVAILAHDWNGPYRELVLDDLPIAGVRGTLKSAFAGTAAERAVFAKTGTLSHVSALAGYAANARHGAVIFAFTVDDWTGDAGDLRETRGRVLSLFVTS